MTVSQISTHVLNTATGRPAVGVNVELESMTGGAGLAEWHKLASGSTDDNGRATDLGPAELVPGAYRLRFETGSYFAGSSIETFFPEVILTFTVAHADQHYHVPLLISPFAYSTYRGN